MDRFYLKVLYEDNEQISENKYMKDIILNNEELLF
jgi:hypothetical protein